MDYRLLLTTFTELLIVLSVRGCVVMHENYCKCDIERRGIYCSRLRDSVDNILPGLIPETTSELEMKRVWVDDAVELQPRNFATLKSLTVVDFSFNRISEIHPGTFSDMEKLALVNLSHNRLKLLDSEAFKGYFPNMHELNLSHNRILVLIDYNLDPLINLQVLDLRGNPILFISGQAFLGLVNLEMLSLSSANFTKFPAEPLFSLPNLRFLELRHMQYLKSVPSHAFRFNRRLQDLVLENFPFTVASLSPDAFAGLRSLRHLTIKSCNLSAVPSAALEKLENLETLDISRNLLEVLFPGDFEGLTSLRRLVLQSTNLEEIKVKTFSNLRKLEYLDLSNNRLKTLYRESFPETLTSLRNVTMTNNAWSCDCSLAWFANSKINVEADLVTCADPSEARTRSLLQAWSSLPGAFRNCSPPKVKGIRRRRVKATEGGDVALPCEGIGKPPLTYTWLHAGSYLPSRKASSESRGRLTIQNVQKSHAGEYTCIIRNAGGTALSEVRLDVQARSPGYYKQSNPDVVSRERKQSTDSGSDCYADTSDRRRAESSKPSTRRPDVGPEKNGSASTAVLVSVLVFVGVLVIVGVAVFLDCARRRRQKPVEGFPSRDGRSGEKPVENGVSSSDSRRKPFRKCSKIDDIRDAVVLGGHGIYSRPPDDLERPFHRGAVGRTVSGESKL